MTLVSVLCTFLMTPLISDRSEARPGAASRAANANTASMTRMTNRCMTISPVPGDGREDEGGTARVCALARGLRREELGDLRHRLQRRQRRHLAVRPAE